jgi:hypothetical protein
MDSKNDINNNSVPKIGVNATQQPQNKVFTQKRIVTTFTLEGTIVDPDGTAWPQSSYAKAKMNILEAIFNSKPPLTLFWSNCPNDPDLSVGGTPGSATTQSVYASSWRFVEDPGTTSAITFTCVLMKGVPPTS